MCLHTLRTETVEVRSAVASARHCLLCCWCRFAKVCELNYHQSAIDLERQQKDKTEEMTEEWQLLPVAPNTRIHLCWLMSCGVNRCIHITDVFKQERAQMLLITPEMPGGGWDGDTRSQNLPAEWGRWAELSHHSSDYFHL